MSILNRPAAALSMGTDPILHSEASNGTVYDTLTAYSCVQTDLQLFTYNSAIILGGLIDLYTTTRNSSFLSTAQNIAYGKQWQLSLGPGTSIAS